MTDTSSEPNPTGPDPKKYPKMVYSRDGKPHTVHTPEDEADFPENQFKSSPADWGIETAPGVRPDPEIAKARREFGTPAPKK
jgi:hypothetical protein